VLGKWVLLPEIPQLTYLAQLKGAVNQYITFFTMWGHAWVSKIGTDEFNKALEINKSGGEIEAGLTKLKKGLWSDLRIHDDVVRHVIQAMAKLTGSAKKIGGDLKEELRVPEERELVTDFWPRMISSLGMNPYGSHVLGNFRLSHIQTWLPQARKAFADIDNIPIDSHLEELWDIERDIITNGGLIFSEAIKCNRPDDPLTGEMVLNNSSQYELRVMSVKESVEAIIQSHKGGIFKALSIGLGGGLGKRARSDEEEQGMHS
jgi:hypothetical protein